MRKITRRAFLGGSMGAAAGTVLAGAACGRDGGTAAPGPAPRFELGMASYTFREFDLESTLAMARRLGLTRIALKSVHLPLASPEEAIRAAAAKVKAAGLVLYGCGALYSNDDTQVDPPFPSLR